MSMNNNAKSAILKAKIEGVISELMVKTDAANVYVDASTTLAAKLTAIIADIATKASTTELTNGLSGKSDVGHAHAQADITGLTDALAAKASTEDLTTGLAGKADKTHTHAQSDITGLTDALAGKAAASHTHAQSEITGLTDALALLAAKTEVTSAIDALRQELLGDTPVEAYNTFTELASYITEHQEVSDALTAAIGNKADKATTLAGYGITDTYTKTETDSAISDAISTATGDVKASDVQSDLNSYKTSNDARVEAIEAANHTHSNKNVLDALSVSRLENWEGKSKVYYSSTEPSGLSEQDLWVQIVV